MMTTANLNPVEPLTAPIVVGSGELLGFPPVIDVCCGSRMFWFDRKTPQAIFVDKRTENHVLCDGRKLEIAPDVQADFTDLPFPDSTFYLVVFDPPHMTTLGANSWMAKKYGRITGDWKPMIKAGFEECFRVLKPNGTLVFKWNETDVKLKEVLKLSPIPPLFGHTTGRQAKTVWATFLKPNDQALPQPADSGSRNARSSDVRPRPDLVEETQNTKNMIEDAKLTKSGTPAPEVGSSFLFGWLGEEIDRHRRNAEQAAARADRLATLMAGACSAGQWRGVRTVKLVTDQAYLIRRPGTTSLELATWNDGWRTIMGGISNGGELEVWEPNNAKLCDGAEKTP